MSEPQNIPSSHDHTPNANSLSTSPIYEGSPHSLMPNPIITKRTRTVSMLEMALERPTEYGVVKQFCRVKGHGFIKKNDGGDIFVHISDIDGEYVPKVGDEVSFRLIPIPPKCEKFQAVHVQITNFTPEVHLRWETPLSEEEGREASRPSTPYNV